MLRFPSDSTSGRTPLSSASGSLSTTPALLDVALQRIAPCMAVMKIMMQLKTESSVASLIDTFSDNTKNFFLLFTNNNQFGLRIHTPQKNRFTPIIFYRTPIGLYLPIFFNSQIKKLFQLGKVRMVYSLTIIKLKFFPII